MARKIKKAVKVTTIKAAEVKVENGTVTTVPLEPVETIDKVTANNAVKIVKEIQGLHKSANIVILSTEEREDVYTMDINKFMMYADKAN